MRLVPKALWFIAPCAGAFDLYMLVRLIAPCALPQPLHHGSLTRALALSRSLARSAVSINRCLACCPHRSQLLQFTGTAHFLHHPC